MAILLQDSTGQLWQISPNTDGSLTTTQTTSDLTFPTSLDARDTSGQLWQLTVETDGSLTTSPVTDAQPEPSDDGCTVTLQSVVDLCRTHTELMPLANVGGFSQEPALSLANDTIQELLSAPYDWKFNSADTNLIVTQPSRQDYLFAGASAFVPGVSGASIAMATASAITQVSTTTTVVCMQAHGFSVGQTVYMTGNTVAGYNSTYTESATGSGWSGGWVITATPTPLTFTITTTPSLGASGAPGITDFAWLQSATMYDTSANSANPHHWDLQTLKTMRRSSQPGRPEKVCVISQSAGILKIRVAGVPGSPVYGITLHYQKKPPLKTDLTQTWAPIPDEFGFVYRQQFLSRCYRFLDHRRADAEAQRALLMINKALGRDDVEESDQYVIPERSIMGDLW